MVDLIYIGLCKSKCVACRNDTSTAALEVAGVFLVPSIVLLNISKYTCNEYI